MAKTSLMFSQQNALISDERIDAYPSPQGTSFLGPGGTNTPP